jgi:lipopolysaccharide/colanic/teichoic acid biosynthesis glycosyltransferase
LAFFILLDSGFTVLYKQTGWGKWREYQMIKFRTMRKDARRWEAKMPRRMIRELPGLASIRRSHLDELPNINVLLEI